MGYMFGIGFAITLLWRKQHSKKGMSYESFKFSSRVSGFSLLW